MQSRTQDRFQNRRRSNGGNKDSFWGFAVLAVFIVTTLSFAVSVYVDSRTEFLSGGIADESSAYTLAHAIVALAGAH